MCLKYPGPRCSPDAFASLREKYESMTDATSRREYLEGKLQVSTSLRSRLGDTPGGEDVILRTQYEEAVNAELSAKGAYFAALDTYDETPEGQKRLKQYIEEFKDMDPARAQEFRERQHKGAARRARQIELYKRVHGLQGQDIAINDTHDARGTLAVRLGGNVTAESVRNSIASSGSAKVYYKGSMEKFHGTGEVLEISGGRFTVRLDNGEVLERVRGASLVHA